MDKSHRRPVVEHHRGWRATAWCVGLAGLAVWTGGCRATATIDGEQIQKQFPAAPHPTRVVSLGSLSERYRLTEQLSPFLANLIGRNDTEPGQLPRPLAVAVRNGKVVACDATWNLAVVIDPADGTVTPLIAPGEPVPARPVAATVDRQGRAYVADAVGKAVFVVDINGAVVDQWRPPDQDRHFGPVGLASGGDKLFVANGPGHCVEVFSLASGQWEQTIGRYGSEPGELAFPVAVAVGTQQKLYVVDMLNARVQVFDSQGQPAGMIGGPGNRLGQFARPRGVAVGPDGTVYVSDAATQVVQMFDAEGHLLMHFGGAGDGVGAMQLPAGLAVSTELLGAFDSELPADFVGQYVILVANQLGRTDIGVYAFGWNQ